MESKAYSYNSEEWGKIGKSALLGLSGVAVAYITMGVFPAVSLVLTIGDWSIDLVPIIAAGIPVAVNMVRVFIRGKKED